MFFGYLQSASIGPIEIVSMLLVLVWTFALHELAHAWMAVHLGDPTPKIQGRLTLNPIVHMDPIGFLLILVVGFGWAKPVMTNPTQIRGGVRGMGWVALAGPITNLLIALVATFALKGFLIAMPDFIQEYYNAYFILHFTIVINLILCIFNFLPLKPLDGYKIALAFLPVKYSYKFAEFSRNNYLTLYFMFLLLMVLGLPTVFYDLIYDVYFDFFVF